MAEELTLTQQIKVSANAKLQFRQNNAYAYVTDPELLAVMEAIAEVIEPLKKLADNPVVTIRNTEEINGLLSQAAKDAGVTVLSGVGLLDTAAPLAAIPGLTFPLIHSQAAVAEFPETHVESNTTDGAGAHTDPASTEPAAGADGTKTVEQGTGNTPS